jgi:hypothetical protein
MTDLQKAFLDGLHKLSSRWWWNSQSLMELLFRWVVFAVITPPQHVMWSWVYLQHQILLKNVEAYIIAISSPFIARNWGEAIGFSDQWSGPQSFSLGGFYSIEIQLFISIPNYDSLFFARYNDIFLTISDPMRENLPIEEFFPHGNSCGKL